MSGRITHAPAREHHCNAGWRIESDTEAEAREARVKDSDHWLPSLPEGMRMMIEDHPWAAEGSIWTCDECGQDWKATYPYDNVFAPTWVKKAKPWKPWWRR